MKRVTARFSNISGRSPQKTMVISVLDLKEGIFHEKVDSPAAAYLAVVRRNVDVVACRRRVSATDVLAR
jgi:hypothetical protein